MIIYGVHWHKYYLSARIKYKSATARADATVNVWLLFTYIWPGSQTNTVASALTVTEPVYMRRFRLSDLDCQRNATKNPFQRESGRCSIVVPFIPGV